MNENSNISTNNKNKIRDPDQKNVIPPIYKKIFL